MSNDDLVLTQPYGEDADKTLTVWHEESGSMIVIGIEPHPPHKLSEYIGYRLDPDQRRALLQHLLEVEARERADQMINPEDYVLSKKEEDWTRLKLLLSELTGYPSSGWRMKLAAGPNFGSGFIDVPTFHHLSQRVTHEDPLCSYNQTNGGMGCDCGAVEKAFRAALAEKRRREVTE